MMFGYRDEFEYIECANCGCIFLKEIPANLDKYYPSNYYSMAGKRRDLFIVWAGTLILRQYLRSSVIGKLLARKIDLTSFDWMKEVTLEPHSSILDVGCGIGKLLLVMRGLGYEDLTGIDPFIPHDLFYKNGVRILKKELQNLQGEYDFIMLHHSFEHMPEPLLIMNELRRHMKPDGTMLLRMPITQTYAWRVYGTDWFQLDAPRHTFLQSIKSFQLLAEQVGLRITHTKFDSTEMQLWGSEQYRNDISLYSRNSYITNRRKSIFSRHDIKSFKRKAIELNTNGDGDQACFFVKMKS